ncbi:MltR family transcriptional regulator [Celerinatantimonas diazotrophica]|uniref:Mannitol repressor MtlR n=1 Tax=Celerinatantimonas diazotrophica TaxID=412034 RepID=A0A4R1J9N4_9GAMM|nr:MltR family transcriptional regulator [Celerinatantimonas diazotrophica]TCK47325.1 mannitol repressor MtlR [Celerinatantimonas diazotrophica]CAG9295059.1 Mannitol operon repressor [Celerinatantimonas diazotrophica]
MAEWIDDSEILEKLNQTRSVRGFMLKALEFIEQSIADLVERVFQKDDYAVKYAVTPLLKSSGPLGDVSVRLKLIFGLGIISKEVYQDIELMASLRDQLNNDPQEYQFSDEVLVNELKKLHTLSDVSRAQLANIIPLEEIAPSNQTIYQAQQEKVIHSIWILSVITLYQSLHPSNSLLKD